MEKMNATTGAFRRFDRHDLHRRVQVAKFRTIPAFEGIIEEIVNPYGCNIRAPDGRLWFRSTYEVRPLSDVAVKP